MKTSFYTALRVIWQAYTEISSHSLSAKRVEEISAELLSAHTIYQKWAEQQHIVDPVATAVWYLVCMMFDQAGIKNAGLNNLLKNYWIQHLMTRHFFKAAYPEEFLETQLKCIQPQDLKPEDAVYAIFAYVIQHNVFDIEGKPLRVRFPKFPALEEIHNCIKKEEQAIIFSSYHQKIKKHRRLLQAFFVIILCILVAAPWWILTESQTALEEEQRCQIDVGCALNLWIQQEHYSDKIVVQVSQTGWYIRLNKEFSFETGHTLPNAPLHNFLIHFSQFLQNNENKITIIGHADSTGSRTEEQKNKYISAQRAYQVSLVLQTQGISSERIFIQSRGAEAPVMEERDNDAQLANRRVEFFLYSK